MLRGVERGEEKRLVGLAALQFRTQPGGFGQRTVAFFAQRGGFRNEPVADQRVQRRVAESGGAVGVDVEVHVEVQVRIEFTVFAHDVCAPCGPFHLHAV